MNARDHTSDGIWIKYGQIKYKSHFIFAQPAKEIFQSVAFLLYHERHSIVSRNENAKIVSFRIRLSERECVCVWMLVVNVKSSLVHFERCVLNDVHNNNNING